MRSGVFYIIAKASQSDRGQTENDKGQTEEAHIVDSILLVMDSSLPSIFRQQLLPLLSYLYAKKDLFSMVTRTVLFPEWDLKRDPAQHSASVFVDRSKSVNR